MASILNNRDGFRISGEVVLERCFNFEKNRWRKHLCLVLFWRASRDRIRIEFLSFFLTNKKGSRYAVIALFVLGTNIYILDVLIDFFFSLCINVSQICG